MIMQFERFRKATPELSKIPTEQVCDGDEPIGYTDPTIDRIWKGFAMGCRFSEALRIEHRKHTLVYFSPGTLLNWNTKDGPQTWVVDDCYHTTAGLTVAIHDQAKPDAATLVIPADLIALAFCEGVIQIEQP